MEFIKQGVTKALSWRVLSNPGKRFIFLYHDVSEPSEIQHSELYSTSLAAFRAQIDFLIRNFKLVSLDNILSPALDAGRARYASITFDDGFLSVQENAMPYLSAKGIPFAVFVNRMAITENRLLNGSEGLDVRAGKVFLDERDVQSLSRNGVTIGSHSASHRTLTDCDDETLREEIEGNKLYLERLTGLPIRYLALPFGKREHYNERVLEYSRQAGHEFVFTTNPTFFDLSSPYYERRLIPRIGFCEHSPAEATFLINRPLVKTIDI